MPIPLFGKKITAQFGLLFRETNREKVITQRLSFLLFEARVLQLQRLSSRRGEA